MRQRQRQLVSLITRLRRVIDITRIRRAQRSQITLQNTDLLTQITNLALQLLHLIPMPGTALLRFTSRRVQFLLQAGGRLPLALDFQQRPGLGGFEPLLRPLAIGTQLVQFGGEVTPGGFERSLQLLLALLRKPYLLLQRRRCGDGDRQRLFPFCDAGLGVVQRRRTARQFLT
jgi:hypothetical protein